MKILAKKYFKLILLSVCAVIFFGVSLPLFAALPSGFEIQTIATGLNSPTSISFAPDGRIFIAEKSGVVRVVKNGVLLSQPLITLSDVNSYGDRGLIGIAVDPNFLQNGYLYLSYTFENTPGANYSGIKTARIVRVTVAGDYADESTKLILVGSVGGNAVTPSCDNYLITSDCIPSDSPSHSVGALRFGPDGKLYAVFGDGAHFDYADVRSLRAQNLDSLAGKILRINTNGTAPTNNPFYDGNPNSNRSKVYAYGLRNAFRFNFRPTTGAIYAGDVGWSNWEEINKITPGGNYGWPCREGNSVTVGGLNCTAPGYINPAYVYPHDVNGAGSVTGGAFPSGSAYPAEYMNSMFFGDYAQNWLKTMAVNGSDTAPFTISDFGGAADSTNGPVEFATGPEGNVYFISIYTGELKKITHTLGNRQPITQISSNITSGIAPLSVNFSSVGSSDPDGNPITFLWNFGDTSTSSAPNPNHVYTSNGIYNATLTVFDNFGGQQTKSINITVGNQAPTAVIVAPTTGSLYTAGQNIILIGSGVDPENGNLPNSSMSWRVILHHNIHTHILETPTGNNIAITGPDHNDPDVYTEIELTVTDSGGLTNKKSVNIYLNNAGSGTGNLVDNPNLETADPNNPGTPANWSQDWWGSLNPIFTYPAPGYEGVNLRGAKVQITAYTSGDAKWVFAPISTAGNTTYTFSDYYTSNVSSTIVAEIGYINGTYSYTNLGTVPAATSWTKVTKIFTTPANARNLTVLHLIENVGVLTVDNYSLMLGTSTPPLVDTTKPLISITSPTASSTVSATTNITASSTDNVGVVGVKFLIDGIQKGLEDTTSPYSISWNTASSTNGNHNISAVSRDLAGNIATSTISVGVVNGSSIGPNLITNGTFETASGALPLGWKKGGWGTNTRVLTYPVVGSPSAKAARVEITAYPANGTGDAKWVHDKIPVTPGTQYRYTDRYRSNIISDVIGEYTLSNGTFSYFGLAKEIQPSNTWQTVTGDFLPPVNATHVTFYHLISSIGFVEIDDVETRVVGSGTPGEIIPPIVEFTNPLNGQTVSGTVNLTASSTDNVAVTYIFYAVDGDPITGQLTIPPYNFSWNTVSVSNGSHLLKATTHDPSGNNSTATITVIVNNGVVIPDTTKPLISITSPTASSTVSATTNITASSTDNVGVVGVKFLIDGIQKGLEDTTSPYSISWNTASSTNGNHNISAVSRDLAGNIATSTAISVTVNNVAPPTSANLILNPSLEIANGSLPLNWRTSKWGTNTATFTYPTAGQDGAKAVKVAMTAFTSGDAKWFFDDVTVTPGVTYTFTEYYKSSAITNVTVRWTTSTGAITYQSLGNPAIATNWTLRTSNLTIPAGVTKMTIFHLIKTVGTLEIDNYSLVGPGGATDTTKPLISITSPTASSTVSATTNITASSTDNVGVVGVKFLIDGIQKGLEDTTSPYSISWNTASSTNGNHNISAVSRDLAGNIATSTISVEVNNVVADTTVPTVAIVSPLNGSTASSTLLVTINANDNVALSAIKLSVDSVAFGSIATGSPATYNIDTTLYANGAHTITAVASDTSNNFATSSAQVIFSNIVPDLTAPVVSITSPIAGTTIGATSTITVSATDNIAVSNVHIIIDGENIGIATTLPYDAIIDTTSLLNGVHVVSAYAEDPSGNIGNATPVSFTVYNAPVIPPDPNLILNPSLEIANPGNLSLPENWFSGSWGTNNALFTYPIVGIHGARGARIEITSYTDGDAKWYFQDVPVTPGSTYTFREEYRSNTPTTLTARFKYSDNSVQYRDIITLPSASSWSTTETSVVIPVGAVSMTVFHVVNGVGYLEIDNYYLAPGTPATTNTFAQGMVSLSFDDGWLSQYDYARPVLSNAHLKGSFYIISQESIQSVPDNRLSNGNLETVNPSNPNLPANWTTDIVGTNNAVFTYPISGVASSSAVKIEMTSFTNGEAQWIPASATVITLQDYIYSGVYKSDTTTTIVRKYVKNDNSVVVEEIAVLPPASDWTAFSQKVLMPANLKNVIFYHSLRGVGYITLDNLDLNRVPIYMSPSQIQQMWSEGQEIGAHTKTHADLTTLTTAEATDEIVGSRTDLVNLGLWPVDTFVYPYGGYNSAVQQIVKDGGYVGARSVDVGYNTKDTDKYALKIQQVDNTTTFAQFQTWVDEARNTKTWLVLMFHQIDNQNLSLGVTPALFQQMVNFLVTEQVTVVTVGQGIGQMTP